jgi:hypothetical protein
MEADWISRKTSIMMGSRAATIPEVPESSTRTFSFSEAVLEKDRDKRIPDTFEPLTFARERENGFFIPYRIQESSATNLGRPNPTSMSAELTRGEE